jgi:hypothetical protein
MASLLFEEETVYNLVPKPPPVIVKPPLHVSQFAGSKTFETAKKYSHQTMGEPFEQYKRDPKTPLKAHERTPDLPPRPKALPHGNATLTKPPVPRTAEIPPYQEKPKRNFIVENWRTAPKTRKLRSTTPQTWYTDKADFGQRPKYLDRVHREVLEETAFWDDLRQSLLPEDTETRCKLIPQEERLRILDGLSKNLADNKRRYAALACGMDHMSFRKRKEGMEDHAAQLEDDIKIMERRNVYVSEN